MRIRIQTRRLSWSILRSWPKRLNKAKNTLILNHPIEGKEKYLDHGDEEYLGHIELPDELKASYHDGQSSLDSYNKMSGCETAWWAKTIETALPEHHVQSIELETDNENEEHVAHHAPVKHFELERSGSECYNKHINYREESTALRIWQWCNRPRSQWRWCRLNCGRICQKILLWTPKRQSGKYPAFLLFNCFCYNLSTLFIEF